MTIPIALDVDGILTNFDDHWRQCAEQVLGRPVLRVSDDHSMRTRYALTNKECDAVWEAYHAGEWHRLPLYPHAAELIHALEQLGTVWAVTSVKDLRKKDRAASLEGLIPESQILCVGEQSAQNKMLAMQTIGVRAGHKPVAFLDDHPENVNAVLPVVGLTVLLDRGYTGLPDTEYGVTVIDDPMDFPVLVEQFLKRTGRAV